MQLPEGWESRYDSDTVRKILLGKMISSARGWDAKDLWRKDWPELLVGSALDNEQLSVYNNERDIGHGRSQRNVGAWFFRSFNIPVWHCMLAYLISELEADDVVPTEIAGEHTA